MSGSVSSNDSTKLVRRSGRPASAADLDPQSIVWPDPLTDLIVFSSCDEDSSDEESIDLPVQANLPDREDGANSGDEFDHLESEFEEEGEEEEIEGDEHDFEDERLHSSVRVDPMNPLGPGLGPEIELVWIDNMPTLSTIDTIRDMIRGRNLLISEEDILIPTAYDRPWTPPEGFLCPYESFFNASAVWFPLPKLLIEYCDRRLIAVSQLTHAAVRNIVTVLTLAAEIGRSCRTGFVLVLLRTKSITSFLYLRSAENKTGRNSWNKELRGQFNFPLAPLRPFTLRIPKDRKPRSKKAKAQSRTMVKAERKVVKYTRAPMFGSVPKYDKKAEKKAVYSSSLKPSSAIVPAKKQRGESFGKGVGKGNVNRWSKSIEPASSGIPTMGGEIEETGDLSTFDFEFSFKGYGKHISDVPENCAEFLRCVQGHLRQYDPSLDFADKPVYTLYAEELVRAVSHVNFIATRLEKTELKIVKLTSEVEALKGKLDRQVEISMELTKEAENARGRAKEAGNKFGMLRDQLERERNERDVQILLLKEENEKLKAAGSDVVQRTVQTTIGKALSEMRIRYEGRLDHLYQCSVDVEEVNRLNSLINQVKYSLELYAGLRADGIDIPEKKIKKLQADLKSLNEEFDSLDVEVAKPGDYLVTLVADRVPLDLPSFQLDLGERSRTRPAREDVPATEEAGITQDGENAQDKENAQDEGGEVDAIDASTNEGLAPLFPSS
ncbi:hypothetical protein AALP_AA2G111800 [Arabis alpina]|uniref:DUF1204 domain-containing protein n=1 Tax=Arabis alpina TaxID=50452 RepID=A0A087HGP3_ARAAL|nr:hypothetical protein AALP_AA2G111800 [Arabis alpina]